MKLSVSKFDGFLWCSKYSFIKSSDTTHVLHTQYHIDQKCFHQYLFHISGNSSCIFLDVLHFIFFTKSLILIFGSYSICMCIWSLLTTHFIILTSSLSHICFINSFTLNWTHHSKILYLYFVTNTICAVKFDTVWLFILIFIVFLFLIFLFYFI